MKSLDDYEKIIGVQEVERIRELAEPLEEKTIAHVSSTFYGGGVSEMLASLIALLNDVGIRTEWRLCRGSPDFFAVTKKINNAMQGNKEIYLSESEKNSTKKPQRRTRASPSSRATTALSYTTHSLCL